MIFIFHYRIFFYTLRCIYHLKDLIYNILWSLKTTYPETKDRTVTINNKIHVVCSYLNHLDALTKIKISRKKFRGFFLLFKRTVLSFNRVCYTSLKQFINVIYVYTTQFKYSLINKIHEQATLLREQDR